MKRLLIYSHDAHGTGDIRLVLALGEYLVQTNPQLSILLITGSATIHNFQLPPRLEFIQLPALTRGTTTFHSSQALATDFDRMIRLRADLILAAATNFDPDIVFVHKNPAGMCGELAKTLGYLKLCSSAQVVLILGDILDSPEKTIAAWKEEGHTARIASYYDKVLVLGTPEIFDPVLEYKFPPEVAAKTTFCGYIGNRRTPLKRGLIRRQLGVADDERLIVLTPGEGQDGQRIVNTYRSALVPIESQCKTRSLIVTVPEMSEADQQVRPDRTGRDSRIGYRRFVDNTMPYMEAADLVVSTGDYNTICEILATAKPAIVIPNTAPVQEQQIRTERMAQLGLLSMIHPNVLTPASLAGAIEAEWEGKSGNSNGSEDLDLNALVRVAAWTDRLSRTSKPSASPGSRVSSLKYASTASLRH